MFCPLPSVLCETPTNEAQIFHCPDRRRVALTQSQGEDRKAGSAHRDRWLVLPTSVDPLLPHHDHSIYNEVEEDNYDQFGRTSRTGENGACPTGFVGVDHGECSHDS
jgi:hypothetical protein